MGTYPSYNPTASCTNNSVSSGKSDGRKAVVRSNWCRNIQAIHEGAIVAMATWRGCIARTHQGRIVIQGRASARADMASEGAPRGLIRFVASLHTSRRTQDSTAHTSSHRLHDPPAPPINSYTRLVSSCSVCTFA